MRYDSLIQAIGRTPLVPLRRIPCFGAEIWLKCEHLNPSGSVKDRMALHIIGKAEAEGKLKPGGFIVENTSGNTGAAVAMIARAKGYRAHFTIPDKMSREKIDALRAYGAEVTVCPTAVPPDDPRSYYSTAQRLARENPGSFYVNQYNNRANIDAYLGTLGRDKVGFTVVGRLADGQPRHVGGMRGVVERNSMRYYLAIEAFLGARASPGQSRAEKSFRDWVAAIERYPRQLHDMEQGEYLAMKRKEYLRQQPAVAPRAGAS